MLYDVEGKTLNLTLNERVNLAVKGLEQYDQKTLERVRSFLKICKPELIQKIKAGIELEPVPQVQKMTVCVDSMPCKYIGLSSDEWGTYATCLYNGGRIHEQGFICPLASERLKKRLGIQDRPKRKYQPKKKVSSIPEVQQVELEQEPEEVKTRELPRWAR